MSDGDMKTKVKKDVREIDILPYEQKTPKTDYIPDGYDDVASFLEEMRKEYEADTDFDRKNRDEAVDDKRFAAGYQWDEDVLEQRKGLPCLKINSIPQFTAQLVGDWRESRNAVKVVPAEDGDVEIASIRGDLIRAIEMTSRASRVYDSAFESTVICGDGAFRVSVDYAKDDVFDQEILIKSIDDAQSVVWDRMSIDPTGRDARHCFVDDSIPISEFKKRWESNESSTLMTKSRANLSQGGWIDDHCVKVTEYWRILERDRLLGLFEDGSVHVIDAESMEEITQSHGMPVKTRISPCLYAQMHLVTGFSILSGPYEWKLNRLPIIRMTGRVINVDGERIRYGLVRFMKDPVRLRNFWRSVAAEQLGYAPKAQWLAQESSVEGREDQFRKAHLSRDPLLVYNDGAEPPERIDPPQIQMALLNEAQINTQDMKDVTGIHDASLGIKSNETSGKAINARQREGDIASLTYYDNGNASILEAGDVINQWIPQVYDATRIIRTIGEDEAVKLQKINDPNDPSSPNLATGKYDVALTTGTSYSTRRVAAAEAMMSAGQVWPELFQIAGDLVAKAQDWPGADKLSERIKKAIPQSLLSPEEKQEMGDQQQGIDPQQMQDMAGEFQKMQQENQQLQLALKDKTEANAINWYNAETQRIRALSDNEVDGNQMEMDAIDKILNHGHKIDDRDHAAEQADLNRQLEDRKMKAAASRPAPKGANK